MKKNNRPLTNAYKCPRCGKNKHMLKKNKLEDLMKVLLYFQIVLNVVINGELDNFLNIYI